MDLASILLRLDQSSMKNGIRNFSEVLQLLFKLDRTLQYTAFACLQVLVLLSPFFFSHKPRDQETRQGLQALILLIVMAPTSLLLPGQHNSLL
jgi:hypothetical protein